MVGAGVSSTAFVAVRAWGLRLGGVVWDVAVDPPLQRRGRWGNEGRVRHPPPPPGNTAPPTYPRDALEGKGPQRRPQQRLDRRLEEVAEAVGGGYCRLQMPLRLALGVRGTVAGHRLGALEGGGYLPPFPMHPCPPPPPSGDTAPGP